MKKARLVILISGRGSNMQSILRAITAGKLSASVAAVISNQPEAEGLKFAAQANIDTRVVNHRDYNSREDFDNALSAAIDSYQPDYVILAGFMRILTAAFVNYYAGRLLNIHPSLLPKYKGLHTHQRAIEAGETEHGASVHFVTAELDDGPVILQAKVPVLENDTPDTLAKRVLNEEHKLYPDAIELLIQQGS